MSVRGVTCLNCKLAVELKASWHIGCIPALQIQELARILLGEEPQSQVRLFSSSPIGSVLQRMQKWNALQHIVSRERSLNLVHHPEGLQSC